MWRLDIRFSLRFEQVDQHPTIVTMLHQCYYFISQGPALLYLLMHRACRLIVEMAKVNHKPRGLSRAGYGIVRAVSHATIISIILAKV